jgi:hypothetical protein
LLKLFLKETPYRFQHVDEPVAVTYQLNTIPDNHNLTALYQYLAQVGKLSDAVVREVIGASDQPRNVVQP